MKWHFSHSELSINPETHKAQSSTTVKIELDGVEMTLYQSEVPEDHVISTRKALVDSGHLLRRIGLEMLRKADKINQGTHMKFETQVGTHTKGQPYPTHDFSYLEGIDMSWVAPYVCCSNEKIAQFLEMQYNRSSKFTKCDYVYYVIHQPTEESCTNQ